MSDEIQPSFLGRCATAGTAGSWAEFCTLPLDTAKVRLQIQATAAPGEGYRPYTGVVNCVKRMSAEEGFTSLWKGLGPGIGRQVVYASLRIGLYEPIHNPRAHEGVNSTMLQKIAAGLTTGAIGMMAAQPTDVVKIRFQADAKSSNPRYKGMVDAFSTIAKDEGITGLWTGIGPNILRNSIINAAELACYDGVKETLVGTGAFASDWEGTHLVSSFTAGFMATCVGSPFDVIKTRIMNAVKDPKTGKQMYSGFFDCFFKILTKEGPGGFYKGFIPNFSRIGSWNVVMFMTYEQIKKRVWPKVYPDQVKSKKEGFEMELE